MEFLHEASTGDILSEYHLEAGIAAMHASAISYEQTDWKSILKLYDLLIKINPNSVGLLNRTIVICQLNGPLKAIEELKKINDLDDYYLYHSTLGEFYFLDKQYGYSIKHFEKALSLTGSKAEKKLIESKIKKVKMNL